MPLCWQPILCILGSFLFLESPSISMEAPHVILKQELMTAISQLEALKTALENNETELTELQNQQYSKDSANKIAVKFEIYHNLNNEIKHQNDNIKNLKNNFYDELFNIGGDLYPFLEEALSISATERHDPPFYKIVTKSNGREIYILGSIHDRHPALILPQPVFQYIKNLSSKAVLCIEHTPPYEYLMKELRKPNNVSKTPWKPVEVFKLSQTETKIWNAIKEKTFSTDGPKIEDITKMDETLGVMLFHCNASEKAEEMGIMLSFEKTLLNNMVWLQKDLYLEELRVGLKTIDDEKKDRISFFTAALPYYNNIIKIEENPQNIKSEWFKILTNYEKTIHAYDYDKFLDFQNVKPSSRARNALWPNVVINHLKSDNNSTMRMPPLLIVCGAEHLRGGISKDSQSFLEYLLNTNHFKKIERMDKEGRWVHLTKY